MLAALALNEAGHLEHLPYSYPYNGLMEAESSSGVFLVCKWFEGFIRHAGSLILQHERNPTQHTENSSTPSVQWLASCSMPPPDILRTG